MDLNLQRILIRATVDAALAARDRASRAARRSDADRAMGVAREHHAGLDDLEWGVSPGVRNRADVQLLMAVAERSRAESPDVAPWEAVVDAATHVYHRSYATWRLAQAALACGDRRGGLDALETAIRAASRLGAAHLVTCAQATARKRDLHLDDALSQDHAP